MTENIFENTKYNGMIPIIYDVETYKDVFCCITYDTVLGEYKEFTFDNIDEMVIYFLSKNKCFVGYNSISFDDIVMRYIIRARMLSSKERDKWAENFNSIELQGLLSHASTPQDVYNFVQFLFRNGDKEKNCGMDDFNSDLWKLKYYQKLSGNSLWMSLDLMTMNFGKISKRNGGQSFISTGSGVNIPSLKELGIVMQLPKLQDLPYKPDANLNETQRKEIIDYCYNDVYITRKLYEATNESAALRVKLEEMYEYTANKTLISEPNAAVAIKIFDNIYVQKENIKDDKTFRGECSKGKESYKNENISCSSLLPKWVAFKSSEMVDFYKDFVSKSLKISSNNPSHTPTLQNLKEIEKIIKFRGINYKFALGGLHSQDDAGMFTADDDSFIIDVDVTSYYPSIMINNEIYPRHLTSTYDDILKDITSTRINAKKCGDKLTADALKIVINSLFGKTNSKYSSIFDPKSTYSTTVTGQMGLLMLIEALESNGFSVISANTDGVTSIVPKKDIELFRSVCNEWESITSFNLEETFYTSYVREHVNSYIAFKEDGIKTKGWFEEGRLNAKHDQNIVKKAVIEYFNTGVPVEDTIKASKNIHDFVFYYKSRGKFVCYHGGKKQQRINRWYISVDGTPVTKTHQEKVDKKNAERDVKIAGNVERAKNNKKQLKVPEIYTGDAIPNALKATLVNDINNDIMPNDIDYDYYILNAKKMITKINLASNVLPKLHAMGLYTMPKKEKSNPKGFKQNIINLEWQYGETGIGIYTGSNCGILVVDMDNIELLTTEFLSLLSTSPSLTIWHGEGTNNEVLSGKKRGSIVYRFEGDLSKFSLKSPLKKKGFEILYGVPAQIAGFHPDGTEYTWDGEIQQISDELLKHIVKQCNKKSKKKPSEKNAETHELLDGNSETILDKLKEMVSKALPKNKFSIVRSNRLDRMMLLGDCPYSEHHNNKSGNRDFNIYVTEDFNVYCNCYHSSCLSERDELTKELNALWTPIMDNMVEHKRKVLQPQKLQELTIAPHKGDTEEEILAYENMSGAINGDGFIKLIHAEPGSGKTYAFAVKFLEYVKNGERVLYITNNKQSTLEFTNLLKELASVESLREIYTEKIESNKDMDNSNDEFKEQCILDTTIGVVTHNTYLSRKGHTDMFFKPVFAWLSEKPAHVFIDEIDSYIEKQNIQIQLETRYHQNYNKACDITNYIKKQKCSKTNCNRHGCGNCTKMNYLQVEITAGIPYFVQPIKFTNKTKDSMDEMNFDEALDVEKELINVDKNEKLSMLKQRKHYLHGRKLDFAHISKQGEIELLSPINVIRDMINCSYNPTIWEFFPTVETDGVVERIDVELLTKDVKYKNPTQLCETRTLTLQDKAGLYYINQFSIDLTMASGTIKEDDIRFLKKCLGTDIKEITIKETYTKLCDLLFIGFAGGIPARDKTTGNLTLKQLYNETKVLRFKPNAKAVVEEYSLYGGDEPVAYYRVDTTNNSFINSKYNGWEMLVASSRGKLHRATNLSEFGVCTIDTRSYKPTHGYNLDSLNEEQVEEVKENDRRSNIKQAYSRIFRNSKNEKLKKLVILEYTTEDEMIQYAKEAEVLCERRPEVLFYENDYKMVLKTSLSYITSPVGLFDVSEEVSVLDATKTKKQELKQLKKKEVLEKLMNNAKNTIHGISWSKFSKSNNISRLKKSYIFTQHEINEIYITFHNSI